jgi:O-antigen ligase
MGLGYHYEIVQPSADGKMETARLGYVHNFVAYFLMTTGLVGTLAYLVLIGAAAFELLKWFRRPLPDPTFAILITMAVTGVVLLVDAFFFAVFRLIPFNLYFGAALGILVGLRSAPDPKMHPVPRAVEAKARLTGRNIAEM